MHPTPARRGTLLYTPVLMTPGHARADDASAPRVLVVGPSWIGDMVMAQSLFALLRQRLPEARIDVAAPAATAALTARMPEVDRAVVSTIRHREFAWRKRRAEARALAAEGYRQAIVLQRSAKAALVPWLAGIPRRTGYRGEWRFGLINDVRTCDTDRYPRKVEHYAVLGLPRGTADLPALSRPRLNVDHANRARRVEELGLDTARPVIGFAPGAAFGTAKRWPAAAYAELAGALDARGVACWVFGGADDRDIAARMTAAAPRHGVDLCGHTRLVDVVDLASLTTRVVGNDTGIMHLAAASAPSVVAIYGPTDPAYAPPLAAHAQSFWLGLECSPCRARVCPLGHNACMRDIPVTDVLAACLAARAQPIASRYHHAF